MQDIIRDIQQKIRQNRFPNEASISQGIVLRLIRALGWNVDDIDVVWPEFATGTQRADYALCHPAGKPLVLIEVKQAGTMNVHAEEQLAAYAYHHGVPLVILTSGQDWHFYAPYGPGQFSDRRIYRLDLLERTLGESEERLQRYLSYDAWVSGQASLSVQADLREMLGKQETRRKLPEAWESLLAEPSPHLVELLTAQLEKQTGSEPPKGEVVAFLKAMTVNPKFSPVVTQRVPRTHKPLKAPNAVTVGTTNPSGTRNTNTDAPIKLWINGVDVPVRSNKDRLTKVMNFLVEKDPGLPEKFSQLFKPGQRPTFAKSPPALFPKAQHLVKHKNNWAKLAGQEEWYLDLNKSASTMRNNIEMACQLAGVKFGTEVKID